MAINLAFISLDFQKEYESTGPFATALCYSYHMAELVIVVRLLFRIEQLFEYELNFDQLRSSEELIICVKESNEDLLRGVAGPMPVPNCNAQHCDYKDGILEHSTLFRVASCDILSCFWYIYMSFIHVAFIF